MAHPHVRYLMEKSIFFDIWVVMETENVKYFNWEHAVDVNLIFVTYLELFEAVIYIFTVCNFKNIYFVLRNLWLE